MIKQPKFDIYQDTAGEWRWRLKAANGRIIADGAEGYSSKAGARRAVDTVVDTMLRVAYIEEVSQ